MKKFDGLTHLVACVTLIGGCQRASADVESNAASRSADAQELEPLAPAAVHRLVTNGRPFYEGTKVRAVLSYGETGGPTIQVEQLEIEMAWPDGVRVVDRYDIDVSGGLSESTVCPLAETWCAPVTELEWVGDDLHHTLSSPNGLFACVTSGLQRGAPRTACEAAEP